MITFIEKKDVDWDRIQQLLYLSYSANQWSNFGPISLLLEQAIAKYLQLEENKCVVFCSNGTDALFCLVQMYNFLHKKPLKWTVSSFGFHCSKQGPLANAAVVDCDKKGLLDLNLLDSDFDGILVTNPFGITDELECYKEFCKLNHKILICDSASAFDSLKKHDVDEVVSFHHTKPWGFGEGGCVIIDKQHELLFRSITNFGTMGQFDGIAPYSTNAKASEISCAYVLQRFEKIISIKQSYIEQYNRIKNIAENQGFQCVIKRNISNIPHCVPFLATKEINNTENPWVKIQKYYKPLSDTPNAQDIYKRIINMPCHPGLSCLCDKEIVNCLEMLIRC